MLTRRMLIAAAVAAFASTAQAQEQQAKLPVVASFSILGDVVRNVGGDNVGVTSVVGPESDAHVYWPSAAVEVRLAA